VAETFAATVTSGGGNPLYQWEVNGGGAGSSSSVFTISTLNNGDVISCAYSDNSGCTVAPSNTIIAQVQPIPVVSTAPPIILSGGQSVTLDLPVTGDVTSYVWTPATGLSDPDMAEPVATPKTTTTYTLTVTSPAGCIDSGQVVVKVGLTLAIPSAFSPNGDGRNDMFYVIGGPAGSVVKELAVFDRWGQRIFQAHDTAPDDPAYGWNGTIGGQPAAPGAYVYVIEMGFANGTQQVYKGAVLLVR
jgi:gliding motility-associated-like protein